MSTGAQSIFFAQKRILGLEDFQTRLSDFLQAKTEELFALTYSVGGVYVNQITFTASGADEFDLDTGIATTDGSGHVLTLDAALGENIQFENTIAITYFVGLRFATRPRGVQMNPRTGMPEFQIREETIGDSAVPDAVVDLGATLEITVDSATEPGVNNAGRQVLVFKNLPGKNATSEAVAIETATVVWNGVNNKIVTAAQFGQVGTPSTTPADYTVVLLGPTVKRNTDLSAAPNNAFIGTVIGTGAGNPPAVFDVSSQNRIDTTLTGLDDITRVGTNLDLKVSVDGHPLDSGENQIEVLDTPGGTVKFSVDEQGNVRIEGNLVVVGTETVQNVETILTNQVIAGNLLAGDADTDSHTLHGTVTHTSTGFGGTPFSIDGVTGVITMNGAALATSIGVTGVITMISGSNLNISSGADIEVLSGGDINVQSGADIEVANGADINVAGNHTILSGGFLNIVPGARLTFFAGGEIQGDMIPNASFQDIGSALDPWDNLFVGAGVINSDAAAGVDSDRIIFQEDGFTHFALRANFTDAGNSNEMAWNSPNGQLWVMNRLGESVWGLNVTDSDLVSGVNVRILPTTGSTALNLTGDTLAGAPLLEVHPNGGVGIEIVADVNEGIHISTSGEIGTFTEFNSADVTRVPVDANTAAKFHNRSASGDTSVFIDFRNDATQTGGGYMGAIRTGGTDSRLLFGTRTAGAFNDPAMWITEDSRIALGTGTAAKIDDQLTGKLEFLAEVAGTNFDTHQLAQSLLFNSSAPGAVSTGVAWLSNAHAANASHIFIGDRGSLGVTAPMQRPVSVFYEGFLNNGILPTAFAEYSSWDFSVTLGSRGASAGLIQLAGVNFTNPSDSTQVPVASRPALLAGRNWNDSILCRGIVRGSSGTPVLELGNANWKNVDSIDDNGTGNYRVNFDVNVADNYTVVATVEDASGAEDQLIVTFNDIDATGFELIVHDVTGGAGDEDDDVHFIVFGKPNTTVTW